jgi:hypothetical protein
MGAPANDDAPRAVCFMIMPYGRKPTQAEPDQGPGTINFDALWERVYLPVLSDLGYDAVRADQDAGALIINQMIERLYFSELVLADLTAPNGNVYYEVGIRHAMQEKGCVLLAADWARPLFDVAQMRSIRYPLSEGEITEQTAEKAQEAIRGAIAELSEGPSPVYTALNGYPDNVDQSRASAIQDQLRELAEFQGKAQALRELPGDDNTTQLNALVAEYERAACSLPTVAHGLIRLMQDSSQWTESIAFIEKLPRRIRELPLTHELYALALGKAKRHRDSISALLELITLKGATSEREGLLGGRFKDLYRAETHPGKKRGLLQDAIRHYEVGMTVDLNDYYPSCNLPRLYRRRNAEGDEERARTAAYVALAACRRSMERNPTDDWARPTLMAMAFDAADPALAARILAEIQTQDVAGWHLESCISDVEDSLSLIPPGTAHDQLAVILAKLKTMV